MNMLTRKAQPPRDTFIGDLFWTAAGGIAVAWVVAEWLTRNCPSLLTCV